MMRHSRIAIAAGLVAMITSGAALASTPFAGDDLDVGGFDPVSVVFTPDNSANDAPGTWAGGSFFDRFGVVTRDDVPNDVNDDSPTLFVTDTIGFIPEGKTDNFFLLVDVTNDQNPSGDVSAEWTFDVSGRTDLELSIDFAMVGEFESADLYEFSYQIDDGPELPAFTLTGLEGTPFGYTMDDGDVFDRIGSGFFNEGEWDDLVLNGPTEGFLAFHPGDEDIDGLIDIEFAGGVEGIRAYTVTNGFGTFDQTEFAPTVDPLGLTSGDGSLVDEVISADGLTTYTTALTGAGTTLTLKLTGNGNGGNEYLTFDNIVLSEGDDTMTLAADFNGDGTVDLLDLDILGSNFGGLGTPATGDANGDMNVDLLDLDILGSQFGQSASSTAIPEPTAAVLACLALAGFARRTER